MEIKVNGEISLNPCCNGCRTWAGHRPSVPQVRGWVLILVVMDVALGLIEVNSKLRSLMS